MDKAILQLNQSQHPLLPQVRNQNLHLEHVFLLEVLHEELKKAELLADEPSDLVI